MQFDIRFILIFSAIALFVIYAGSGNLSFQEATLNADKTRSSINADQLDKLLKTQARFNKEATPFCTKTAGAPPGGFKVVVEMKPDGTVRRSWRNEDSKFAVCFQNALQNNFVFKPYSQRFFMLFEYARDL